MSLAAKELFKILEVKSYFCVLTLETIDEYAELQAMLEAWDVKYDSLQVQNAIFAIYPSHFMIQLGHKQVKVTHMTAAGMITETSRSLNKEEILKRWKQAKGMNVLFDIAYVREKFHSSRGTISSARLGIL